MEAVRAAPASRRSRKTRASFRTWAQVVCIAAVFAVTASSAAAGNWVAVPGGADVSRVVSGEAGPQPPHLVVDWYDDSGLALTIDVGGVQLSVEETEGGEFALFLPDRIGQAVVGRTAATGCPPVAQLAGQEVHIERSGGHWSTH